MPLKIGHGHEETRAMYIQRVLRFFARPTEKYNNNKMNKMAKNGRSKHTFCWLFMTSYLLVDLNYSNQITSKVSLLVGEAF